MNLISWLVACSWSMCVPHRRRRRVSLPLLILSATSSLPSEEAANSSEACVGVLSCKHSVADVKQLANYEVGDDDVAHRMSSETNATSQAYFDASSQASVSCKPSGENVKSMPTSRERERSKTLIGHWSSVQLIQYSSNTHTQRLMALLSISRSKWAFPKHYRRDMCISESLAVVIVRYLQQPF